MVKIRLQRVGRRNHAEFRIVATEHTRAAKSANVLEILGNYNPHTNTVAVKEERVLHWISNGAQVSDTLHNILVNEKIIKGKKKNVLPRKTPIVKESTEEPKKEESTEEKASDEAVVNTPEKKEDAAVEKAKETA